MKATRSRSAPLVDVDFYSTQLEVYASAFESPRDPRELVAPITQMGLLVFEPELFSSPSPPGERIQLEGRVAWLPVERRHEQLRELLGNVIALLDGDLPAPAPQCDLCAYLASWPR